MRRALLRLRTALFLAAILGISASVVAYFVYYQSTSEGIVAGTIVIGPVCPGAQIVGGNAACTPSPPSVYLATRIVMTPVSGNPIHIGLNATGGFRVSAMPGTYQLNIENCAEPLDCSSLPSTFQVFSGQVTRVHLELPVRMGAPQG